VNCHDTLMGDGGAWRRVPISSLLISFQGSQEEVGVF
jgi:hypothetical protein